MNEQARIWVLEDDPGNWFVIEEILGLRYQLTRFDRIEPMVQQLQRDNVPRPQLLVADIRLPGESFLHFLGTARAALIKEFPFLVLSSVDDLDALRFCFERGAVDYLTKPFAKAELVVKVERALVGQARPEGLGVEMDPTSLTVVLDGKRSERLTSKEFQILSLLVGAYPNRLDRRELLEQVWREVKVEPNTLDVHLSKLRHKLGALGVRISTPAPLECALEFGH